MGNCLQPVSLTLADNSSQQDWGGFFTTEELDQLIYDYEDSVNDSDVAAAAPCHSCNLLDASSLPFFLLLSVLGLLANAAVLSALLRPLFRWRRCADRPILAQLAAGSALFSLALALLAPGLGGARPAPLCQFAHLAWHSSAFAQALLITSRACLGPRLGAGWFLRLIPAAVWAAAIVLGLPSALTSDSSEGSCPPGQGWGLLHKLHVSSCWGLFVLLPLGLLGAKGLKKALGKGPCPRVDVLWIWFIFWWPYGVMLGVDDLVRSQVVVIRLCQAQQAQDLLLQLAEGLAMVHCVATPLLLALACHRASHLATPPLPPAPAPRPDALVGKA
ncbi:atypical chemokine receptor 1 [Sorex fumeus]|uniref:atypical chemokine receptor 1 n=1 Tax=Sorex fumeus TaxID=62283 RepID=UPI0024ADA1B0|nr:atypical chemokine receptor 1 [Sorex fumeus]